MFINDRSASGHIDAVTRVKYISLYLIALLCVARHSSLGFVSVHAVGLPFGF